MNKTARYVAQSFLWGSTARILDAIIKFVSVPLLLSYFGKADFGLISLAISVNAYLQLFDLGVNTGAIKYFSEWIHAKKFELLNSVAQTSISFYGIIGLINAIVLLALAFGGLSLFNLTNYQAEIMRDLLVVLALVAVVNWSASVFNQLLIANENIAFIQKVNIVKSLLGLILILIVIYFKLSLFCYFTAFVTINSLVLIPTYIQARTRGLIRKFLPGSDWANFSIIFKYSLAIIAMSIFQMTAIKLRPVVLSMFSLEGVEIVADFRIMETITIFIISVGGMFTSIFLPRTSRILLRNQKEEIAGFAYNATRYTSIICVGLCVPFILNSNDIITLYVGKEYLHLTSWLNLWLVTILFFLHNSPIASLVLSTGKTRVLVFSSAFACFVSLIINVLLCNQFGAGSAVIGYSIYILIQMLFYYFYFNNKILGLHSLKVFRMFISPTLAGFTSLLLVWLIDFNAVSLVFKILVKSIIWFLFFIGFILITKQVDFHYIRTIAMKSGNDKKML